MGGGMAHPWADQGWGVHIRPLADSGGPPGCAGGHRSVHGGRIFVRRWGTQSCREDREREVSSASDVLAVPTRSAVVSVSHTMVEHRLETILCCSSSPTPDRLMALSTTDQDGVGRGGDQICMGVVGDGRCM